ncbi:hypothetical protein ABT160_02600 [Streptomyces sp. NPDC001941]
MPAEPEPRPTPVAEQPATVRACQADYAAGAAARRASEKADARASRR